MAEQKTGHELIDQIIEHPTLDTFLDRDLHGKPLSREDGLGIIILERKERAYFDIKQERKVMKKQGIELKEEPKTNGEDENDT